MQTSKPLRVLIADDHMLVREGLRSRLEIEADFEIVGEAIDGQQAIDLAIKLVPDLLLVDLDLPIKTGAQVSQQVKALNPIIKVVILTGNLTHLAVDAALAAGADGYVTKHDSDLELLQAIRIVMNNESYISNKIATQFSGGKLNGNKHGNQLTQREQEILLLIASGASSSMIADSLGLAVGTVRKHRENLMAKLDLHNTAGLTAFAIKHGVNNSS